MQSYGAKTALLGSIIDYAGTFPPAALPIDKALVRAATFRGEGKHPWLMAKVALPFSEIKKLSPKALFAAGADGTPWLYTALGSPLTSESPATVLQEIEWELREIRRWVERSESQSLRQMIVSYETKFPVSLFEKSAMDSFLPTLLDRFTLLTGNSLNPFFEIPAEALPGQKFRSLTEAAADWTSSQDERHFSIGVKLRFGADDLKPQMIAAVLAESLRCRLKFKATQALHSALTHGKELGFVNLFTALTLAHGFGLEEFGEKEIQACLVDSLKKNFHFENGLMRWRDFELDCEAIETAKRRHGATFGSCSLDEPDQSLAKEFP